MMINELISPEEVELTIEYHRTLNPVLWKAFHLKPEVSKKLDQISYAFIEFLKIPNITVLDRVITGSNANYNWTSFSDIDLHVVLDLTQIRKNCSVLIDEYVQSKKKVWNDMHDVQIYGFDVELYAQDSKEVHFATGIYSLEKKDWLIHPERKERSFNDAAVRAKVASLMNQIDALTNAQCNDPRASKKIKEKIKSMRQAGLERAGEFSVENLAFKVLRNNNYLEKLAICHIKAQDKRLSLF